MGKPAKGVAWILVVHREPLWANFKEEVQGDVQFWHLLLALQNTMHFEWGRIFPLGR